MLLESPYRTETSSPGATALDPPGDAEPLTTLHSRLDYGAHMTDFRACGFSPTGRTFVIATARIF